MRQIMLTDKAIKEKAREYEGKYVEVYTEFEVKRKHKTSLYCSRDKERLIENFSKKIEEINKRRKPIGYIMETTEGWDERIIKLVRIYEEDVKEVYKPTRRILPRFS